MLTAAVNDDFGIQNPSGVSSDTVGGFSDWTLLIQKISYPRHRTHLNRTGPGATPAARH